MKKLLYAILLIFILCSCSSVKYVPVETVRTEYKTRDSIRHDSIYQHDSVFYMVKGDTVYKYREKYLYKYLFFNKTDTILKVCSIQVPYPIEKQLARWENVKIMIGGWVINFILVFILAVAVWMAYKRIRK